MNAVPTILKAYTVNILLHKINLSLKKKQHNIQTKPYLNPLIIPEKHQLKTFDLSNCWLTIAVQNTSPSLLDHTAALISLLIPFTSFIHTSLPLSVHTYGTACLYPSS